MGDWWEEYGNDIERIYGREAALEAEERAEWNRTEPIGWGKDLPRTSANVSNSCGSGYGMENYHLELDESIREAIINEEIG